MVIDGLPNDLSDLLGRLPVSPAAVERLIGLMSAPGRFYHDLSHIELLWRRHCQFGAGTEYRAPEIEPLIASAIAYHDAINDPFRFDNELESAALWREEAAGYGQLAARDIDWVAKTIEATARHFDVLPRRTSRDRARIWVLDLDLTPLGESDAVFRHNTELLRLEALAMTQAEWERRRLAFLSAARTRPRIFRTPVLAAAFEAQARANLAAAASESETCVGWGDGDNATPSLPPPPEKGRGMG